MENIENVKMKFGLPVEFISKCKSIRRGLIRRHIDFLSREKINIKFSDDCTSVKIGDLSFALSERGLKYCGDESHKYSQYTINCWDSFGEFLFAYEKNNTPNDLV